jgi:5-formyltetrahydrofolate cyclo-ligase
MRRAVSEIHRRSLRAAVAGRRRALAQVDCCLWSGSIQAAAIDVVAYRNAHAVVLYSPVQNEVDTAAILSHALGSNKRVFYPKLSIERATGFARIRSRSELVPGPHGILEPAGHELLAPVAGEKLIVFLPGLLFDRQGNRLGRGGGWYDRALRELDNRGFYVGLAYEFQLVDSLPAECWDQRVHLIITEKSRVDCGRAPH